METTEKKEKMKRNIFWGMETLPQDAQEEIKKIWEDVEKKTKRIWIIFLLGTIVSSALAFVFAPSLNLGVEIFFGVLSFTWFITLLRSWSPIEHKEEFIVELYGKFIGVPLTAGLHIIFPWFGFFILRKVIPKREQIMGLHLYEGKEDDRDKVDSSGMIKIGGGDIEFLDGSASIKAFFYYLVEDSIKATYNVVDYVRFIEEKVESALRVFLGTYTIDEVIKLKSTFTLEGVILGRELLEFFKEGNDEENGKEKNAESSGIENNPKKLKDEFEKTKFFNDLKNWGIFPDSLVISDIELPETVKIQRERKLVAEKDLQVKQIEKKKSEIEKAIRIIQAEAEATAREKVGQGEKAYQVLLGQGFARKLASLIKSGVSPEEAARIVNKDIEWSAVSASKSTDKTIIVGTSHNNVTSGAEFGAGFNK